MQLILIYQFCHHKPINYQHNLRSVPTMMESTHNNAVQSELCKKSDLQKSALARVAVAAALAEMNVDILAGSSDSSVVAVVKDTLA